MNNEEAIKILKDTLYDEKTPTDYLEAVKMGREALENQKTGHWIELGYAGNDNYDFKCSECKHSDIHSKIVKVNYCWYCGAKMEG